MREKFVNLFLILIALLVGIVGTLYFTGNRTTKTVFGTNKNVTINEDNTLNSSIQKIYNAVVVVESYRQNKKTGSGSGFVYKKDDKYGYILTNYHVVAGASSLKVIDMNGESIDAVYLGGDSYADIAVVRIDVSKVLDVASIGESMKSKLGDTVFTVGTPVDTEYMGSVTKGIISGENRTVTVSTSNGSYMMEVLQTDASINPGNSGGPLVNINGEVIGITSMKLVTDSIEGMGFAIPIEIAMSSVEKLELGEKIERPYIGVSLYDIGSMSLYFRGDIKVDDNITNGAVVAAVEPNGDAAKGKLSVGDVIVEMDGTKVKSTAHFKYLLYKHDVGDTIRLKVNNNGKEKGLSIKLTKTLGD